VRRDGLRPQYGERSSTRLVVGAVDDQHTVEVIELVLDDSRGRTLELELEPFARSVEPYDRDLRSALDRNEDVPKR
jgi:hypothetical protein